MTTDPEVFAEVLAATRRFVREVVVPAEEEIESRDEIPAEIRRQAAAMGLYGFALPERYGGLGLSMEEEVRLVFELGYTSPAFRSMFGTNNGIAGHVLLLAGSEDQRVAWLARLASGEVTAAFALTEPGAGSDPTGLTTTAVRDGDGWRLDGTKRYITNAPVADVFMVFARTSSPSGASSPETPPTPPASAAGWPPPTLVGSPAAAGAPAPAPRGGRGISVFLVPRATPGLSVGPRDEKMGQRGAWTADVVLEGAWVPAGSMVGAEGTGYATSLRCLAHGRLHIAAVCVGLAERLVDESVAWASTRRQSGRAIATFQLVQAMLADSATDHAAARALVLEAARAYDAGTDTRRGPAMAKYFASEALGRVADRAVQVHGGAGYVRGSAAERFYRDARLFRIYEGTSQIQQLVIARSLLRSAGVS